MATTIQVSEEFKNQLKIIKGDQSYEDFLKKLIKQQKRLIVAEQMKEYGQKHGEESLKEVKEWEHTDVPW